MKNWYSPGQESTSEFVVQTEDVSEPELVIFHLFSFFKFVTRDLGDVLTDVLTRYP